MHHSRRLQGMPGLSAAHVRARDPSQVSIDEGHQLLESRAISFADPLQQVGDFSHASVKSCQGKIARNRSDV